MSKQVMKQFKRQNVVGKGWICFAAIKKIVNKNMKVNVAVVCLLCIIYLIERVSVYRCAFKSTSTIKGRLPMNEASCKCYFREEYSEKQIPLLQVHIGLK